MSAPTLERLRLEASGPVDVHKTYGRLCRQLMRQSAFHWRLHSQAGRGFQNAANRWLARAKDWRDQSHTWARLEARH